MKGIRGTSELLISYRTSHITHPRVRLAGMTTYALISALY